MALHADTEIYKATYDLCKLVTELVANMQRNYKADFGAELRKRCMALVILACIAINSIATSAYPQSAAT